MSQSKPTFTQLLEEGLGEQMIKFIKEIDAEILKSVGVKPECLLRDIGNSPIFFKDVRVVVGEEVL